MTDSVLDLMKFVLLGLLYVFFARVLWAVWSEVRVPKVANTAPAAPGAAAPTSRRADVPATAGTGSTSTRAATAPMGRSGTDRSIATGSAPSGAVATKLVISQPEHLAGQSHPIADEPTIGRHDDCAIAMADDSFLSGRHARVFVLDDQPMVEDLDSTNGSFHNGARFGGIRLISPGDTLNFGSITVEVR